jgi:hypothetical protein
MIYQRERRQICFLLRLRFLFEIGFRLTTLIYQPTNRYSMHAGAVTQQARLWFPRCILPRLDFVQVKSS